MFRQYKLRDFRLRLVMLVYAISILSVFVVGSAAEEYQNQQIMGIVIGSAAMLVLTFMDYRILLNFAWVIYIGNLVLLLLVDLIGQESNGAKRWLKLGFLRFQPSELTKLALIVFFAYFFTKYREKLNSFRVILASLILLGIPLALVLSQPHLSATITIMFIFCVLIFAAGLSYKIIGSIFFPLIMNQKTFQSGFDKFVDYCLNLFPVITVIAEHQSVDGKAAIHLKIKNRFCLFKGQEAV